MKDQYVVKLNGITIEGIFDNLEEAENKVWELAVIDYSKKGKNSSYPLKEFQKYQIAKLN